MFDVDEEGYPTEWRLDADGLPTCTAFVPIGTRLPTDIEAEELGQLNLLGDA